MRFWAFLSSRRRSRPRNLGNPRASPDPIPRDVIPNPASIIWTVTCTWVAGHLGRVGVLVLSALILLFCIVVTRTGGCVGTGVTFTQRDRVMETRGLTGDADPGSPAARPHKDVVGRLTILKPETQMSLSVLGDPPTVRGEVKWLSPQNSGSGAYVKVALQQEQTGVLLSARGLVCPDGGWRVFLSRDGLVPGPITLTVELCSGTNTILDHVSRHLTLVKGV